MGLNRQEKKAVLKAIDAITQKPTWGSIIEASKELKSAFQTINGFLMVDDVRLQKYLMRDLERIEAGQRPVEDEIAAKIVLDCLYGATVNEEHPVRFATDTGDIRSFTTFGAGVKFGMGFLKPGDKGVVYYVSEGKTEGVTIEREGDL